MLSGKALKLKTAKKEADVEIMKFKTDKETHYKKMEEEVIIFTSLFVLLC